jgi:hypothetical protein
VPTQLRLNKYQYHYYQNCALLRHYGESSGIFLPTFRDNLSVLLRFLTLEDGTDSLSRNAGKELLLLAALIAQNSVILNYFAVEA